MRCGAHFEEAVKSLKVGISCLTKNLPVAINAAQSHLLQLPISGFVFFWFRFPAVRDLPP